MRRMIVILVVAAMLVAIVATPAFANKVESQFDLSVSLSGNVSGSANPISAQF